MWLAIEPERRERYVSRDANLPVEQENGRRRRQCSANLQRQDGHRLSRCLCHPLERKVQNDRGLAGHEELPDVRSCTFICLGRRTVQGDEGKHGRERTERHCHGKKGAGVLQKGW